MATLQQTRASGAKFEDSLAQVINKYTNHMYRNVRIETLLTAQGTTELDILFCFKNIVFIIEAKNVSGIIGEYDSTQWSFIGSKSPNRETREYSSLNVITQNNIHARSFKDMFYAMFGEWPYVVPIIVVPNDCRVSEDLSDSILTISQLDTFLADTSHWEVDSTIHRRVAVMISGDGVTVQRPDFVTDAKGFRVKAV